MNDVAFACFVSAFLLGLASIIANYKFIKAWVIFKQIKRLAISEEGILDVQMFKIIDGDKIFFFVIAITNPLLGLDDTINAMQNLEGKIYKMIENPLLTFNGNLALSFLDLRTAQLFSSKTLKKVRDLR